MSANVKSIKNITSFRYIEHLLKSDRQELLQLSKDFYKYYHPHYKKKSNGKKRKIDHPKGRLKEIQKMIARRILRNEPLPPVFFGNVKGKSYILNALYHVGQSDIISVDVRDFYPSVSDKEVFKVFRNYFCFSEKVSALLTRLTTYNSGLPQGSPTSGYLANFCFLPIYEELLVIAERYSLKISIYADDVTFSGKIGKEDSTEVIRLTLRILKKYGFSSKNKKIEMMPKHGRQIVTGLMINNRRLSITPKKISDCRKRLAEKNTTKKTKDGIINFIKQVNYGLLKKIM